MGWQGVLEDYNRSQQYVAPTRNYFTDPLVQPTSNQANTRPSAATETYQTILVNTPNGLVQKRCKMLNGKAVYCI